MLYTILLITFVNEFHNTGLVQQRYNI